MVFQNQGLPFHHGRIMGAFQFERGAFQVGAKAVPFCENLWGVSRSMSCGNRSTLREKPFHFLARAHLSFSFPEVHEDAKLKIKLIRTLRGKLPKHILLHA